MKALRPLVLLVCAVAARADNTADLRDRLDAILVRANLEDAAARQAARTDLAAWCDAADAKAEALLKEARAGRTPEVQAAIDERLGIDASVREIASMLDPLGLPDVKELRWVEFYAGHGQVRWSDDVSTLCLWPVRGWVVSETEDRLTLLDARLVPQTWLKHPEVPASWIPLLEALPASRLRPGQSKEIDFGTVCAPDARTDKESFWNPRVTELLAYIRWCLQRERITVARRLYSRLVACSDEKAASSEWACDARDIVAEAVRDVVSEALLVAASRGANRKDLAKEWRGLSSLPHDPASDRVSEMADRYASLLEEDDGFVEMSDAKLSRLTEDRQAEYWIHLLRGSPGHDVKVFDEWWEDREANDPWSERDPQGRLKELGVKAVTALAHHLDDDRPTRFEIMSFDGRDPFRLWTIGDVCCELFERITGVKPDDERRRRHAGGGIEAFSLESVALEWWVDHRDETAEERAIDLMDTNLDRAAIELLEIDAGKHLPAIVERIRRKPQGCSWVLDRIKDRLLPGHRDFLLSLIGPADLSVSTVSARILREKFGTDDGADAIAKLVLEGIVPSGSDGIGAIELLVTAGTEACVEAICKALDDPNVNRDYRLWSTVGRLKDRRIADRARRAMDDRERYGCGWSGEVAFDMRRCDDPAGALAQIVGFEGKFVMGSSNETKDEFIGRLKDWYDGHKDEIDWSALRKTP